MERIEIRLSGHPDDTETLVAAARAAGLEAESSRLLMNTVTPPPAESIVIAGAIWAVARCVNTWLKERKRRLQIIRPEASIMVENYTDEELRTVLETVRENIFIKSGETQPNKGAGPKERERGQISG